MLNKCLFGWQSRLHETGFESAPHYNKINVLQRGEGSTSVALPPPHIIDNIY